MSESVWFKAVAQRSSSLLLHDLLLLFLMGLLKGHMNGHMNSLLRLIVGLEELSFDLVISRKLC